MSDGEFEMVAMIEDLPGDGLLPVVTTRGERICLVRRRDAVTAVSDVCTHQDFAMSIGELLSDGTLQCAWHGARFDCRSGAVAEGPAVDPLPVFAVRVEDGRIMVGPTQPRSGTGYEPSAVPINVKEEV